MTFDATQILLAVIALAGAAITGILVPWIKTKITAAQKEDLQNMAYAGAIIAEQYMKTSSGQEKFDYVKGWLRERGITFDDEVIKAAIETAVYQLKR